jgi:two-component system response regulator RegA
MTIERMSETKLPHAGPLRVLVVEDEARLRDMLVRAVNEMGFDASGAASAEAALRHVADKPAPDIAVLDLNLPGMGGMELFGRLRQQHPATQVIILTGFGDLEAAQQAIRFDAVDFLTKPCALGELEVSLDRARTRVTRPAAAPEGGEAAGAKPSAPAPPDSSDANSLEAVERVHILAVLEKNHGNRAATAAELGISLRKLYYRLEQYQQQGLIR